MSGDSNSGRAVGVIFGVGFVVLMALMFAWVHFREPDGALDAWLDGDRLVVLEFRLDEGDEIDRVAVVDLKTGRRLQDRTPDGTPFAVVNGKLWLMGKKSLEAWSLPDLKTVVASQLSQADSNVCSDGAFARVALTDGRYAVMELSSGKVVADRPVPCSDGRDGSRPLSSAGTRRDPSSQRVTLEGYGGSETFLEPQLVAGAQTEGDVFVVHRAQLGDDRELKLSRVSPSAVKWTVSLGYPGSLERVVFAAPVLVMVGHDGIDTLDVTNGSVLWRTGK